MKSLSNLSESQYKIVDYLNSLSPHKANWLAILKDPTEPWLELIDSFNTSWHLIQSAALQLGSKRLKELQPHLAPWPPVITLALNPEQTWQVHAAWSLLLELHTTARAYAENTNLALDPKWSHWYANVQQGDIIESLDVPSKTKIPGVLCWHSQVHIVTTQSLALTSNAQMLQKIQKEYPSAEWRINMPSCVMKDKSYHKAADDLFGNHSIRELNKLAFWSMLGHESEAHYHTILNMRPRYYGGPSGTPSWGLHEASSTGQAAAKARGSMMNWMLQLSDSLHDSLYSSSEMIWTPAHDDLLKAYTYAWLGVTRIGLQHKRSATQVNELFGYTQSILKRLVKLEGPNTSEIQRVLQWTKHKLGAEPLTVSPIIV